MPTKPPAIVVIGLDQTGKPRAATFSGNDLVPATKAASVMNLRIGRAESPEAMAMVKQLPLGRVFATGKGLMPLVKRDHYDRLMKVLKLDEIKTAEPAAGGSGSSDGQLEPVSELIKGKGSSAADHAAATEQQAKAGGLAGTSKPDPTSPAPSPYNPWAEIAVGATVLWSVDPKEGWFPCVITAASKDGKKLTLKWRDFSGFKPFEVKRLAVGLICIVR